MKSQRMIVSEFGSGAHHEHIQEITRNGSFAKKKTRVFTMDVELVHTHHYGLTKSLPSS